MENKNKVVVVDDTPALTKDESNIVSRMVSAQQTLAANPELAKELTKYGSTPVIYGPTKAMVRPSQTPGLLDFIRNAKTVDEVDSLLKRSVKFDGASPGTIRKWEKAAGIRKIELGQFPNPREGHTRLETLVAKPKKVSKTKKS